MSFSFLLINYFHDASSKSWDYEYKLNEIKNLKLSESIQRYYSAKNWEKINIGSK